MVDRFSDTGRRMRRRCDADKDEGKGLEKRYCFQKEAIVRCIGERQVMSKWSKVKRFSVDAIMEDRLCVKLSSEHQSSLAHDGHFQL